MISNLLRKFELLTPEYDDDGMTWKEEEYPWLTPPPSAIEGDPLALPKISGSPELQAKIRALLGEYKHIFSEKLRADPAKLTPMVINIDKEKWQTNKHSLPPRTQSRAKHAEIERQINKMIESKVIRPSQAPWYSQVHLTPKPNGAWRFCIDYRGLNDCSEAMGWPIPNVSRMLQRLGDKRAKFSR